MRILIIGENSSGKSLFAEEIACKLATDRKIYIATMIPYGEEGNKRVKKHLAQRKGKGFITVEEPSNLSKVSVLKGDTVLVEDVSNLVANLNFNFKDINSGNTAFKQIETLSQKVTNTICVSIIGSTLEGDYNKETENYISNLKRANNNLNKLFDIVVKMENEKGIYLKGSNSWTE